MRCAKFAFFKPFNFMGSVIARSRVASTKDSSCAKCLFVAHGQPENVVRRLGRSRVWPFRMEANVFAGLGIAVSVVEAPAELVFECSFGG